MRISTGLVITQIVDIDFEEKSLNMDVEFILKWTDQHIQLSPGYGGKVRSSKNPELDLRFPNTCNICSRYGFKISPRSGPLIYTSTI